VDTPKRFHALIVVIATMRRANSVSSNSFAALAYTSSGTNPSVSTVIASVSSIAAISFAVLHVQAEGAVIDLGRADLDQVEQGRLDALPGGGVKTDHGLVGLGGELRPVQARCVFREAFRAFVRVIRHTRNATRLVALGYGPFP
jgi:hypothetical protein